MTSVVSAEAQRPNPGVPTYDELFHPTYRFQELPSPWPAEKQGFDTPIYQLGWLIRAKYACNRFRCDYVSWCCGVVLPKWIDLGYDTEENKRDGVFVPSAKLYGDHHLFITIADNHWSTVSSMRRPEVRERMLNQAWAVLGLNPKHAKAEKLRWLRYPPPRNTLKKPVTYPAIYCDQLHVLPDSIMELITGSWKKNFEPKLSPEDQHYLDWRRVHCAEDAQQQDDSDASDCSGSTTVGPSG